ncbi:MAG: L-threonylcarbamoyladenylate synthase [Bacteroidota bacterium]|nr:L-threonylcarbamoyladenylate synthase [Bacteroidota bacterium]
MLIKIYPENPNPKQIEKVVETLQKGGIIIYPTDSVYGMGCDIHNSKAVDKIAQIKGIKRDKARFSIICHSLSQLSDYTRPLNNSTFKLMKKNLPGPFTFILNANSKVPALFQSKKKTVGIRIPNNSIILEIVKEFGSPILTTSVHDQDEIVEYTTDPELIHDNFQEIVDLVIDGGYGQNIASTVVDCTDDEPEIIRQGIGELI